MMHHSKPLHSASVSAWDMLRKIYMRAFWSQRSDENDVIVPPAAEPGKGEAVAHDLRVVRGVI